MLNSIKAITLNCVLVGELDVQLRRVMRETTKVPSTLSSSGVPFSLLRVPYNPVWYAQQSSQTDYKVCTPGGITQRVD